MTILTRKLIQYDPGLLDKALEGGLAEQIPYYSIQKYLWKVFMREGFIFMAGSLDTPIDQSDIDLLDRIYRYKN